MAYIIGLLLLGVGLLAVALQRLYSAVPARELKRLAARGDAVARRVYQPVAFDERLRLLLWLLAVPALAGGFVILARGMQPLPASLLLAVGAASALVLLPSLTLTDRSARVAVWCAPMLLFILQHTDSQLRFLAKIFNRYRTHETHSRLYEKEDLYGLLEQQKTQADNRVTPQELALAHRALQFSDRQAGDVMLLLKQVRLIAAQETLGPILLDELHTATQPAFLVFDETPDTLVGTLTLRDALSAKQGGQVRAVMRPGITYVQEAAGLPEVLNTLVSEGQQLAIVRADSEVVGVVTLPQLAKELFAEQLLPDEDDNKDMDEPEPAATDTEQELDASL